jgi:hypothetical protein
LICVDWFHSRAIAFNCFKVCGIDPFWLLVEKFVRTDSIRETQCMLEITYSRSVHFFFVRVEMVIHGVNNRWLSDADSFQVSIRCVKKRNACWKLHIPSSVQFFSFELEWWSIMWIIHDSQMQIALEIGWWAHVRVVHTCCDRTVGTPTRPYTHARNSTVGQM